MSISHYQITVLCFDDDFANHCTVAIREATTPLGKIVIPDCPFCNVSSNKCKNCCAHLQKLLTQEGYVIDFSRILNPITGETSPLPPKRRR